MNGASNPRVANPSAAILRPCGQNTARLACLIHVASVHPEPGSNSQKIIDSGQLKITDMLTQTLFARRRR
ncbi:MAG: hypothetical protein COX92_02705 [Candidatus Nealsonbacteria bacterium CG_4_10_14_0_2_um_filter_40_15]|uniref:Uncharacterized protein n=1 Tax=Candidatus Nealsonbacteria bacterium CG_4_10_14_0_2_um_filter_40_15 TaxID=1974682 RepID=A0A2M7UTV1_9BACT|nr:MAG: hypothetical protein COX92_02705 [Candidatus Nealsonbacteria bacterium CG_4_10_14_0_2_um_filter_40_15]